MFTVVKWPQRTSVFIFGSHSLVEMRKCFEFQDAYEQFEFALV